MRILKASHTDQPGEEIIANISSFSFISQGVIPKMMQEFEKINLWSIYCSWKEDLQKDIHGYPTRFKFRKLKNVLQESSINLL